MTQKAEDTSVLEVAETSPQSSTAAFPADPSSATSARHFVRDAIANLELSSALVERVELVVSELVTNAVLHASTGPTVRINYRDNMLRIEVQDSSPSAPIIREYGREAITGRGLNVVSTAALNWGVENSAFGKSVWAEFDTNDTRPFNESQTDSDRPPIISSDSDAEEKAPSKGAPVVFVDLPIALYIELEQHNEAVLREFELLSIQMKSEPDNATEMPHRLASVVVKSTKHFSHPTSEIQVGIQSAIENKQEFADVSVPTIPQAVEYCREFLGLMLEADRLSDEGLLLTPPASKQVRALRYWMCDELEYQILHGRPPVPFRL